MKVERSDIDFPVWRKKVDSSLLKDACTPIPSWLKKVWGIDNLFKYSSSKKSPEAIVGIRFRRKDYDGSVARYKSPESTSFFKLFISKELCDILKQTFLMSYLRCIEADLRKRKGNNKDAEKDIPFWEFLDIEFDSINKIFFLDAHYIQLPSFPELFKNLVNSNIVQQFENTGKFDFYKSNWQPRANLKEITEVYNVIYYLVDSKKKLLYIGEAEQMLRRFKQGHSLISEWDFFRYERLSNIFSKKQRITLEELIIRTFAAFLPNSRKIPSINISEYKLVNRKIEK